MNDREQRIAAFFDAYAAAFNKGLQGDDTAAEVTMKAFADCFLGADPHGVRCGNNGDELKQAIASGYAYYTGAGISSMQILSCTITLLDGIHAMAQIRWRCAFSRKDGSADHIGFENIYLVREEAAGLKIFAWITGDEQTAMKAAGLAV